MHVLGMLGGIAMAIVVPLVLVSKCGFDKTDALLAIMVISIVSIWCGFALCRHCLTESGRACKKKPDDDAGT